MDIKDLKEKFNSVQNISQSLKEESIRLESELSTLKKDYDAKLKNLLEETGASTFDEAKSIIENKKSELETEMKTLDTELSGYLDTYGE